MPQQIEKELAMIDELQTAVKLIELVCLRTIIHGKTAIFVQKGRWKRGLVP